MSEQILIGVHLVQDSNSPQQGGHGHQLTFVYVFDAFCGWSYGFGPTVIELMERFPGASLDVVSGGLFVGDRRAPMSELGFMDAANREISEASGVQFGPGFTALAAEGSYVMDSGRVAESVAALRALQNVHLPTAIFELQRAFYVDGLDIADPSVVVELATRLGADRDELAEALTAGTRPTTEARRDFERAGELGVTSYPTLLATTGGPPRVVATGLVPIERIEHTVRELAAN